MATGSRALSRCRSRSSHPQRHRVRGWPGPLPSQCCGSGSTRSPPGSAHAARARTHAACTSSVRDAVPEPPPCHAAPGTRVPRMAPLLARQPRPIPVGTQAAWWGAGAEPTSAGAVPVPCPSPCRAAGAAAPRSSESSCRESKNSSMFGGNSACCLTPHFAPHPRAPARSKSLHPPAERRGGRGARGAGGCRAGALRGQGSMGGQGLRDQVIEGLGPAGLGC